MIQDGAINLFLSEVGHVFGSITIMGHHKLFRKDPRLIRIQLNKAVELATCIHQVENDLVDLLYQIDQQRFYVRYGFKSLSGFCIHGLKFSKTQTQRIVTQVRRSIPMDNIVD